MDREPQKSLPRRMIGATALLSAGRLWAALATALTLALLARHLDPASFGRYTFYLACFFVLEGLADFGTGAVAVQRSAGDRAALAGVLASGRRIRAGLAGLSFLAVTGCAFAWREPGAGWIALAALYPLSRVLELSSIVYQNRVEWSVPVSVRAGGAAGRLGAAAGLCALGIENPALFLVAHVGVTALANVTLHFSARPLLPRTDGARTSSTGLWRAAAPLGIAGVCQQAYFWVDNLFVREHCGDEALGHYNGAVRLMSFSILIAGYATAVALPWLSRSARTGSHAATWKLAGLLFALGLALTVVLLPLADELLVLVFGPGFAVAAGSLHWLLGAGAVIYGGSALLTGVVASGRTRSVLWIALSALVLNVVCNSWLVPARGIEGAAIATLGTELFVTLASALVLLLDTGAGRIARSATREAPAGT